MGGLLEGMQQGGVLGGEEAFTLYDTYGFPVDLTKEIAEEYGVTVDEAGYAESLEKAQATARAGSKYGKSELFGAQDTVGDLSATAFVGYDHLEAEGQVLALMTSEGRVDALEAGTAGTVVLTQRRSMPRAAARWATPDGWSGRARRPRGGGSGARYPQDPRRRVPA